MVIQYTIKDDQVSCTCPEAEDKVQLYTIEDRGQVIYYRGQRTRQLYTIENTGLDSFILQRTEDQIVIYYREQRTRQFIPLRAEDQIVIYCRRQRTSINIYSREQRTRQFIPQRAEDQIVIYYRGQRTIYLYTVYRTRNLYALGTEDNIVAIQEK